MWQRAFTAGLRALAGAALLAAAFSASDAAAQLPAPTSEPAARTPTEADELRPSDPQLMTPAEMKSLSQKYAFDIVNSVAKVEAARKQALSQRDGIKVSCIDLILPEMKFLRETLKGRFLAIAHRSEEFTVRAEFVVISPGWLRVSELRQQAEDCTGQALDSTSVVATSSESPKQDDSDPSKAAANPAITPRPEEASRFR